LKIGRMAMSASGVVVLAVTMAGVALARNPHCSGGILYVTQGMKDKDKGDTESYGREMSKAVTELESCTSEDPADFEAMAYLGWAYAEVDSAAPAGRAFAAAIKGLTDKGDKKKADWATGNRNSYWARAFNEGINHIQTAQQAYGVFTKPPADEAETTMRNQAKQSYDQAVASLTRASLLKPGDAQTLRNLGSTYAFMGDFQKAQAVFEDGLKQVPNDTTLVAALKAVRVNRARGLVDEKKFDEAIEAFNDLIKSDPDNSDHYLSLGDAYFRRAQSKQGDARNPDFKAAGDGYARAGELKPTDADLPFNAGLAYQNANLWDKAEVQWRLALKLRPDDTEAMSALGAVLAEEHKYDEAIKTLHGAVTLKPQNKNLHRQLGSIYTKAGNNPKATEELMVYLAMQNGQPAADPAAAVKGAREGSAAAKALAGDGTPEQVISWTADQDAYDTWFYWAKKRAYTFNKVGQLVTKSDWSAADVSILTGGGKK